MTPPCPTSGVNSNFSPVSSPFDNSRYSRLALLLLLLLVCRSPPTPSLNERHRHQDGIHGVDAFTFLHQEQRPHCHRSNGRTPQPPYLSRRCHAEPSSRGSLSMSSTDTDTDTKTEAMTEDVEFPQPLSTMERLQRSAEFWSNVLPIIASYYTMTAEMKVREVLTGETITFEEEEVLWSQQHRKGADKLATTVTSLKGFYVKTAQIIASRRDLFPPEYSEALSNFTDNVDPFPASLAKAVIQKELLYPGEKFEDVFSSFDPVPLGSASVAQVHRATLTPAYAPPHHKSSSSSPETDYVVAIKIQRPSIESKLMGDVANLKTLAKPLRDASYLPLDYYTVFCELEKQLADEFDFVKEAEGMKRVGDVLKIPGAGSGKLCELVVPRPVEGLVTKRVLVMDYLDGVPLSRAREEMAKKGMDPDGPEAKLFGRKLLSELTECFGRCILETGFFHADPHPGNIFVLNDGRVGLIDFGQAKQISGRARQTLAKVMIALDERDRSSASTEDLRAIGELALELGVEFRPDASSLAPPAVAMWLFDGKVTELPGGYANGELDPDSPVKELKSFPQDLVLVGRSTILIKGLSNRLGIPWSLAEEWAPIARKFLTTGGVVDRLGEGDGKVRFRQVAVVLKNWVKGKASRAVMRLSPRFRSYVAALAVRMQERRERRKRDRQKR